MPNKSSSKKSLRKSKKAHTLNQMMRDNIHKLSKEARLALGAKDIKKAAEIARALQAVLDKAAKRHVIHANKAARKNSRLASTIKKAK